ncbi:MAG TPA: hypothetical protein VFV19_01185 [Candidatus Polarisedimenticolaceae bacterium]|nr:hypothetical protein [Candidatus Polarisedimenticolaceae bacterium]
MIRHVVVGACALCLAVAAHASCGTASCPCVTTSSDGVVASGTITVDVSFRYLDQDRKREGSGSTDEVLTPMVDFENGTIVPNDHRESTTASSVMELDVQYGVSPHWSVLGQIPLWQDKEHQHWDGVGTPDEAFVPNAGTRGFGDVRFGARYAFIAKPGRALFGTFSIKAPTGNYQLRDDEGAITEPGMQPGTGAWDGIAEVAWTRKSESLRTEGFVSGLYKLSGRNPLEYRMGDEIAVSGGARFAVGRGDLSIQANLQKTGRDDFGGNGVPSTGHLYAYLTPGGRIRIAAENLSFYGYVQVPVYEHVNEAQLAPTVGVVAGFSKTF